MDSIYLSYGFRFMSISTSGKLNLKEVADAPTRLSFKNDITHTLRLMAIANKRQNHPREIRGKSKGNEGEISQPSDDAKSAKQEEIIALFRRIQSSISKVDTLSTPPKRRTVSNPSQDNYKPSTESVLEILRQSRNQVKGESSAKEGVNRELSKQEIPQKEEIEQEYERITDFKISRPPSSFVKRSPIPSLSLSREMVVQQNIAIAGAETGFKKIEKMKVSELKELAKSKGIKGYSKLKKNEIIELLRSSGL